MKSFGSLILFFIIGYLTLGEMYFAAAIGISGYFLIQIIVESTRVFAFREWALFLYAINYLFSPAVTYQFDQALLTYPMKIGAADYYALAIPGFLCFFVGMHLFKTRIFIPRMDKIKRDARNNESLLINFVIIGTILRLFSSVFPGEIAFFIYLVSSIRFVGAFSLFSANPQRHWKWVAVVLLLELYFGAIAAMYHDSVMWVLFFALYYVYSNKPSMAVRLIGLGGCVLFVLFIQGLKGTYRSKVAQTGKSDLGLVLETSSDVSDEIGSESNILGTLNRGNQAWIFASTIDRMDRVGDFQEFYILGIYIETAILPRFLAPNKLKSGEKKIFNTFSGHTINRNTSMGLGIFADGYIAFGYWGVLFFTFGLGLLCSITFKIVESWSKLSEFYVLMVLPLLNYAVRPDCETQATINHVVKGVLVMALLVSLTKFNFVLNSGGMKSGRLKKTALPNLKSIENLK
jgi:hypothetical protein